MAAPAPELAQIEGKYEILEKLREGGMGALYKVRHRLLEEVRVIKVIRPQLEAEEGLRDRFLAEARSASRLRHPNIAALYDFSMDEEGVAFMVMEYIDGEDLGRRLRREGRLPVGLTLEVAIQSLRALEYLHRNQFVHRDISPDNLMVTRDVDGRTLVKLIDLGIAKELRSEANLTKSGYFLGKIKYASPEQFGAQGGVIGHRSDLYSLGVVLYEVLTGGHPFDEGSQQTLLAGHLFKPPRDFAESDPTARIPPALRAIVLKALEKSPDDRFADTDGMSRALQELLATWREPEEGSVAASAGTLLQREPLQVAFEPGSTQERLDRQFVPVPTRPPIAPVPPPAAPARTAPQAPVAEATRLSRPAPAPAVEPTRLERPAPAAVPEPTRLERPQPATAAPAPARREPAAAPRERAPGAGRPAWLWPAVGAAAVGVGGLAAWLVLAQPAAPPVSPPAEPAPVGEAPVGEAPPAPSSGTTPASPNVALLAGFLGAARSSLAAGDGPAALAAVVSALELDAASGEGRRLLDEVVAAARRETDGARRTANSAGAPEGAAALWSRAEVRLRDAEAASRAGRGADAAEALWDVTALYEEATRVARQSAAPAPTRPEAVATRPASTPSAAPPASPAVETSTPAAEPAVAAPVPPPSGDPQQEVSGIVATLRTFADAHQRLDLAGLQSVWPALSGQRLQALRDSFEGAREIEMSIGDCQIRVEGVTATASCTLRQTYRPKRGTRQTIERDASFELRKAGGRWVIEDY